MISETQFNTFKSQGYNRIPLIARCYADLDTPLSVYLKLANAKNTFLLESVIGGERSGRYSFIGLPSSITVNVVENKVQVLQTDAQGSTHVLESLEGDPLAFIEQYHARFKVPVLSENVGQMPAQLISRYWAITDAHKIVQEIRGKGVVGEQPVLKPGQMFEYTSGCPLPTPVGTMRGSYTFAGENGVQFEVEVPQFILSMPRILH